MRICATALALSGCASVTTPSVDLHVPIGPAGTPARELAGVSQHAVAPAPANGAIFHPATHRPLFEDRRARLPGDTLTVQIEETISASQQSTTQVDRSGKLSSGVTALPFGAASLPGRLRLGAESSTAASGDGKTGSNNTFSGVITVTVVSVLPNGNLLIAGDKQIGVNQNVDVLRFSGVVDPATIRAGNVVSSTQVAQARLEQRGRGDLDRVQGLGWLTRFFLSVAPV